MGILILKVKQFICLNLNKENIIAGKINKIEIKMYN